MSDQPPTSGVYQPPSFAVSLTTSGVRSLLQVGAGLLVSDGILSKDQGQQIIAIGLSVALWALTWTWAMLEKKIHQQDAAKQVAVARTTL